MRASPSLARPAERLDGFDVKAEPLERPHNERPAGELVPQRRVRLGAGAAVNHLAVGGDPLGKGLDTVGRGARLREGSIPPASSTR
jgi:hypothetical protein